MNLYLLKIVRIHVQIVDMSFPCTSIAFCVSEDF